MNRTGFIFGILILMVAIIWLNALPSCNSQEEESNYLEQDSTELAEQERLRLREQFLRDSTKQENAKKIKLLKKMFDVNVDDFEGNSFYTHKALISQYGQSALNLYIGTNQERVWLRFKVEYKGDNWLFMNGMKVKKGENIETFDFSFDKIVRDNNGDIVWEILDLPVTDTYRLFFENLSKPGKAEIRLLGQEKIHDFTLGPKKAEAIRHTLELYDLLKTQ